jgi:ribosome-associated translation inhibitor RaiA
MVIVGIGTGVTEDLREFITRRLHFALGRFAPQLERVTARVSDANGPRGGTDKRCRMEVKLRGLGSVSSEADADDVEAAAACAAERLARIVARALERRQQAKRRPGVSMAGPREDDEKTKRSKEREPDTAPAESEEP